MGSTESISQPELLPLELLQVDDPSQLGSVMLLLSKLPEVVVHYLNKLVFPAVMKHRSVKLQASGVDLGSDMIFGTRLGFSGTPSDLLPRELRPCHYEQGSEAEIIRVLTSTTHVDCEFVVGEWSVDSLLRNIAARGKGGREYTALIDTGALITGYTNEQVARKLLEYGLVGLDACVFIDGDDRRMVVDRSLNAAPVPLDRSGIKIEKRFTPTIRCTPRHGHKKPWMLRRRDPRKRYDFTRLLARLLADAWPWQGSANPSLGRARGQTAHLRDGAPFSSSG